MYRIAICEDEKAFADEHGEKCRRIMEKLDSEYSLTVYDNGADFLGDFLIKEKRCDLLLLDIMLDKTNGLTLAQKIREQDDNTSIIFATSKPDYVIQGYSVNALHYLIKPIDVSVLEKLITADYRRRFVRSFLVFKSGAQTLRIPINDVIFLETTGRRVTIHLADGTQARYYGKLADFINGLNQFVRCHNSFAVNIDNICRLTQKDVIITGDRNIPVSRTYFKETKKAFLRKMRND